MSVNRTSGFSLKLPQNITIKSNFTDLVFSSLDGNGYNTNGMYNPAEGKATVPVGGAGIYLVGGAISFEWNGSTGPNTNIRIILHVNNTFTVFNNMILRPAENDEITYVFSRPMALNAGDTLKLQFQIGYVDDYVQKILAPSTFFYAQKLSN